MLMSIPVCCFHNCSGGHQPQKQGAGVGGGRDIHLGQVVRTETFTTKDSEHSFFSQILIFFYLKGARIVQVARDTTDMALLEGRKINDSHLLLCFRMPNAQYILNT